MYNCPYSYVEGNLIKLRSTNEEDDDSNVNDINVQIATTSLPVFVSSTQCRRSKKSADDVLTYPVKLPKFSPEVTKSLEGNNSDILWHAFINELAQWILTTKKTRLLRREYGAIGQALFKQYPSIGKDGFRPWSYLCKHLTRKLRADRIKDNFTTFTTKDY